MVVAFSLIRLANSKMAENPKDHDWLKCYDMSSEKADTSCINKI